MQKYTFLLPLYNDWESLILLLNKINNEIKSLSKSAEVFIVNDKSSENAPQFSSYSNINKINILNLSENLGSQKAISIGLKYLKDRNEETIITILDSDGEDDVSKVPSMILAAEKDTQKVIVSSRTKRQEVFLFKILYFFHKLLILIFTLKWISFGNFSSFHSKQLDKILLNDISWLAFSSCVSKNCITKKINAERKNRLIGESKLSFFSLVLHSLRVGAVFFSRSILLSLFYLAFLVLLFTLGYDFSIYFIAMILSYNLLLYLTVLINNQKKFINSLNFIKKKL